MGTNIAENDRYSKCFASGPSFGAPDLMHQAGDAVNGRVRDGSA